MGQSALSIKLRCASWQQLATIYKRDLSKGTMFLKAASPPPIGTTVRIDLTLPSSSVIVLSGVVSHHVSDEQRGTGVELKLAPIPTGSIWLIESALASENRRSQTPASGVPVVLGPTASGPIPSLGDGHDMAAAEDELVRALLAEAESLKKLNPFLVLGVGYEATDSDVRGAFGELTKRYHPDRFARYESAQLRQVAAEIFILIRDAYRKLGDADGRSGVLAALGKTPAPRAVPSPRPASQPGIQSKPPMPPMLNATPRMVTDHRSGPIAVVRSPDPPTLKPETNPIPAEAFPSVRAPTGAIPKVEPAHGAAPRTSPLPSILRPPTAQAPKLPSDGAPERPTPEPPRAQSEPPVRPTPTPPLERSGTGAHPKPNPDGAPARPTPPLGRPATGLVPKPTKPLEAQPNTDEPNVDELVEAGRVDDALTAYRTLAKRHPNDRTYRAGIELCEGLHALAQRDRLEAAQRFEAALEIDPSNERAARELAEMRRQATNERKGLLSRLMGKKEP